MITIEKAADILELMRTGAYQGSWIEGTTALHMGSEALKKLQLDRQTSIRNFEPLLPGETKE